MCPHHILGGAIDVYTYTYNVGGSQTVNRYGLWMLLYGVPSDIAGLLDRAIDDGKCDTGSMRRRPGYSCGANGAYPSSGAMDVLISF
jgi:hypothetical protein